MSMEERVSEGKIERQSVKRAKKEKRKAQIKSWGKRAKKVITIMKILRSLNTLLLGIAALPPEVFLHASDLGIEASLQTALVCHG